MTVDDDRGGGRKKNSYIVLYKFNGESQNSIIIDIRIYPLEKKTGLQIWYYYCGLQNKLLTYAHSLIHKLCHPGGG